MVRQLPTLILDILTCFLELSSLAPIYFILLAYNPLFLYFLSQELHFESGDFIFLNDFLLNGNGFIWIESTCSMPEMR